MRHDKSPPRGMRDGLGVLLVRPEHRAVRQAAPRGHHEGKGKAVGDDDDVLSRA